MLSDQSKLKNDEHRFDRIERALDAIAHELRLHRIPVSPLLTAEEVASTLGVSTRTVRRYIEGSRLVTVALDSGRGQRPSVRIQASDLQSFIELRKQKISSPHHGRLFQIPGVERHLRIPGINY